MPKDGPLPLLLVDDHTIVLRGLQQLLEESGRLKVAQTASSGEEALGCFSGARGLVIDIGLSGLFSGLDVAERIHRERPHYPMLFLSAYPEEQFGARAMRAGARGYLTKDAPPRDIQRIAEEVFLEERRHFSEGVYAEVLHNNGPSAFTSRQIAVLRCFIETSSAEAIAERLCMSTPNVYRIAADIKTRLSLASYADVARWAIRNENSLIEGQWEEVAE